MTEAATPSQALHKTPLYALHRELGARLVPFAGYELPLHYSLGILKEHLHTRRAAGLFDVSHMGQIEIRAGSGDMGEAAAALERLMPADLAGLPPGRQRYTFLTNATGGIRDDLMAARFGDRFCLIVNAARAGADEVHLRANLANVCTIMRREDRALLALQGPKAEEVLARLAPSCRGLRFLGVQELSLCGAAAWISRSGYTGEDGFELSLPAEAAEEVARALLSHPEAAPIGLGARDSLRLEAGLCLYGADIGETTDPVEAALAWAIPKVRRRGGVREGGFPGAAVILDRLEHGVPRRRVGLLPEGRVPVRAGAPLFANGTDGAPAGTVTSGAFAPAMDRPVAMGYLPTELAAPGTRVFAEVRGRRLPLAVTALPFLPAHTRRG